MPVAASDGQPDGRLAEQVERTLLDRTGAAPRSRPVRLVVLLLLVPVALLSAAVVVLVRGAAEQAVVARPVAVVQPAAVVGQPRPVRVRIAHLKVDSALQGLDVLASGALAAPTDFGTAGWFEQGTVPGEVGPAVIAGHVDSTKGPAVFYHLDTLTPGDTVEVDRDDGVTLRFAVTSVVTVPKNRFPTGEVYGATTDPELRLVTCGGAFNRRTGSYASNTVVFARLIP